MKKILLFLLIFLTPVLSRATEIDRTIFKNYRTALVIQDRSSNVSINIDPLLSARRVSPCSTFKIYNTLIGLELGLLAGADAPWYKWDGVTREIAEWNHDLTLREAFRASAVPAYQILAREIGPDRMKEYVTQINYGTKNISGGIDTFWLSGSEGRPIEISADEQVALLNKLLDGALPFEQENIAILKSIMEVMRTEKGTLYGKTGSGRNSQGEGSLGWFVGFLESGGRVYVFACNITGGEDPRGPAARAIVEESLRSLGLL